MAGRLTPLPRPDDAWPPRPFDPVILQEIRAALEAFRSSDDVDATLRRVVRAIQRRPTRSEGE